MANEFTFKNIRLVCKGKKTALLQAEEIACVKELANVLFCALAICLKNCPKHLLPIRAKVGGGK